MGPTTSCTANPWWSCVTPAAASPCMPAPAPQPDFIIVERFAVSPEDVKLDRGLSAQALRGFKERALNDEEQKVGAALATVMEEETVRLLREAGIPAYLDLYAPTATRTMALCRGSF